MCYLPLVMILFTIRLYQDLPSLVIDRLVFHTVLFSHSSII